MPGLVPCKEHPMRPSRPIATFFLCCAVFALAACSSKPESAAEAFYLAAEKGNVEKASAQVSFADLDAGEMERVREKVQVVVVWSGSRYSTPRSRPMAVVRRSK
jgi:hypothetical protein